MTNSLSVEKKIDRLKKIIGQKGSTLVAFSGGVDSSFLLAVASQVLGNQVIALMTISASTPPEDAQHAYSLTQALNVRLLTVQHNELTIPDYVANPINRCYFCKNSLYEICRREAKRLSISSIADGVNLDDLRDYRPGLQAAEEYGIFHPLIEGQFNKQDIRQGSKLLGLPTWEKPASPCLSSRVPYGSTITATKLSQIARGEIFIRSLGLKELRVRHHGKNARIEISKAELDKVSAPTVVQKIQKGMKDIGFSTILLDLEGYRGGVFNDKFPNDKV